MTPSQQLARARNCVHAYCEAHFSEETTQLRDSIFIQDGFYRGRRFRGEHVTAVWFAEEDQLKIHTQDGTCVANWDDAEMNRQLAGRQDSVRQRESAGPSTLPMRTVQPQPLAAPEPVAEPVRRAA